MPSTPARRRARPGPGLVQGLGKRLGPRRPAVALGVHGPAGLLGGGQGLFRPGEASSGPFGRRREHLAPVGALAGQGVGPALFLFEPGFAPRQDIGPRPGTGQLGADLLDGPEPGGQLSPHLARPFAGQGFTTAPGQGGFELPRPAGPGPPEPSPVRLRGAAAPALLGAYPPVAH